MTHFGEAFRVHVDAPRASKSKLEEGEICAYGRGERRGKYSYVHERARKTDKELNEPTRGPNPLIF